jgi:hypothetical protein
VGATRDALPDFHATKTAGCTTSDKCHGSSSFNAAFRASGSGADCVRCHNGGFVNAVDTSALADAAPAGHYSVTTHTADPTNMATTINAGGTANAACTACHSNTFRNAHGALSDGFSSTTKGAYLTCQECHGYNAAVSALVTDTVRTNTCAACHATGVLGAGHVVHGNGSAVTGTGTTCASSGLNCHNTADLHAIHKDAAGGCVLTGCHAINKDMTSATKTCGATSGGCHNTYTEATHYATYLANHTSTTQSGVTTTVAGVSPTCGSCHGMALNAEHSLSTSAMSGTGSVCLRCHNNAGSTTAITGLWTGELCSACHDGSGITTMHNNMAGHNGANAGCGNSGVGCHPTQDLSKAGADKTQYIHNDCTNCHDPAGATSWTYGTTSMQYNPLLKTCGGASGCHTNTYYSATVHSIGQAKQRNGDDTSHTATGMSALVGAYTYDNACSSCHSATLRSAHATTSLAADASCNTGGSTGQGCHNSTVLAASPTQVKTSWPGKACTDCHNVPANVHNTYTLATHTATAGGGCTLSSGCHGADAGQTRDIRGMHDTVLAGCTATGTDGKGWSGSCHALNKPMSGALTCGSGGTCHTGHTAANHGPDHGYTTASNYTQTADTINSETGCTNSGAGCHASAATGDTVTTFHAAVAGGCTTADSCHPNPNFADATWRLATGADCSRCHGGGGSPGSGTIGRDRQSTTGLLYEPGSAAHYSETTHTASVNTSVAAGGTASAKCASCHSQTLRSAHGATGNGFSSATMGAYVTCQECHNYSAPVTMVITDATHSAQCTECHSLAILGIAHVPHTASAPVANVGTGTGCASSGTGCHTTADLHALHKDAAGGCGLTGCHDALDKSLLASTTKCGQATGCHLNTQYVATTSHNGTGGLADGDDATHHTATGDSADSIGGYTTASTACTVCHSLTLKTAHTTTSLATDPTCASGGTAGDGCHNSTTLTNSPLRVKDNWTTAPTTRACDGTNGCHLTSTMHNTNTVAAHTVTPGTSCAIGSCHGGSTDVRTIHDRVFGNSGKTGDGCAAAGSDSKGTNPACHALNKAMNTVGTMSCGTTTGTQTTKCHVSHTSSNHGGGGNLCNTSGCHDATGDNLPAMQNNTTYFHHVLDDAAPFAYTGTYPSSTSVLACRSCHVDHAQFNGKAGNLRGAYNDSPTGAFGKNTDFPGSGVYGICVSCHATAQTKSTSQKTGGSAATPIISGANYDASAHDYQVTSETVVGYSTEPFLANCIKCHDEEVTGQKGQTGTYKLSLHLSAENRLAKALGAALAGTSTQTEENLCYACHTGGVAGTDGYGAGTMSAKAKSIQAEFSKTYKHPITASAGLHKGDEGSAQGWNPASSRHVECEDCHNVHEATASTTPWPTNQARRGATPPAIAGANKGVWGVNITGALADGTWSGSGTSGSPTAPTYSKVSSSSYQWQLCLKCHSSWAFTTTPPTVSLNQQNQTGGKQTDVGADFNPMQLSYHPIFKSGLNQPGTGLNAAWATSTMRKWIDLNNNSVNDGATETNNNGLSNTFTDGWVTTSIVVCTDCHNNSDSTGPSGPHGSANKWILSGVDVNVKSTLQDGSTVTNSAYASANFCINCHRVDVYGTNAKTGLNTTAALLSRMDHGQMSSSCYNLATFTSAALNWSSCLHCHGGRKDASSYNNPANTVVQNGSIHGTSLTYHPSAATYTGAANYMGQRFLNGASWSQHLVGKTTTTVGCFNFQAKTAWAADNYSGCTKHTPSTYTVLQYSY